MRELENDVCESPERTKRPESELSTIKKGRCQREKEQLLQDVEVVMLRKWDENLVDAIKKMLTLMKIQDDTKWRVSGNEREEINEQ